MFESLFFTTYNNKINFIGLNKKNEYEQLTSNILYKLNYIHYTRYPVQFSVEYKLIISCLLDQYPISDIFII